MEIVEAGCAGEDVCRRLCLEDQNVLLVAAAAASRMHDYILSYPPVPCISYYGAEAQRASDSATRAPEPTPDSTT